MAKQKLTLSSSSFEVFRINWIYFEKFFRSEWSSIRTHSVRALTWIAKIVATSCAGNQLPLDFQTMHTHVRISSDRKRSFHLFEFVERDLF